jgi:hypothetical protein
MMAGFQYRQGLPIEASKEDDTASSERIADTLPST